MAEEVGIPYLTDFNGLACLTPIYPAIVSIGFFGRVSNRLVPKTEHPLGDCSGALDRATGYLIARGIRPSIAGVVAAEAGLGGMVQRR